LAEVEQEYDQPPGSEGKPKFAQVVEESGIDTYTILAEPIDVLPSPRYKPMDFDIV